MFRSEHSRKNKFLTFFGSAASKELVMGAPTFGRLVPTSNSHLALFKFTGAGLSKKKFQLTRTKLHYIHQHTKAKGALSEK